MASWFQVRRLRLPTRIYADYMPLAAGNALRVDDLLEKLDRLGYREAKALAQPGEFKRDGATVDIYTRAFQRQEEEYPAAPLRVRR